ncbi:MAG: DUF4833 domain-containing protein [Deltaproteobacteria bacterium]|jgi:hypothetical protein|nr:DUF4833 domain-containing protein [Deltaproteobacteria bacterium]MBW2510524.1 DUF4833 domain-containing protein [Deltaproteobacteria bacterium]
MSPLRTRIAMIILLMIFSSAGPLIPIDSLAKNRLTQHLFKIERSTNDNIVQYDVQMIADGKLDPKEPVVAYWVRLAKDGQKEDLKWVEKNFAYGFKVKYNAKTNTATMDMVAKINRKIKVYEVHGEYRAETTIDGQSAYIDKIFISSKGKGVSAKVTFIELFGIDEKTGEDRYERLTP